MKQKTNLVDRILVYQDPDRVLIVVDSIDDVPEDAIFAEYKLDSPHKRIKVQRITEEIE